MRKCHLSLNWQEVYFSTGGCKEVSPSSCGGSSIFSQRGANLLRRRSFFPNSKKQMGIGTSTAATQPSSVAAHWIPMWVNICREKRGKLEATSDRQKVFAAMADAALWNHISIRS